ncbi:unnamed protein product, partial [Symbiodinium sp. KB8]
MFAEQPESRRRGTTAGNPPPWCAGDGYDPHRGRRVGEAANPGPPCERAVDMPPVRRRPGADIRNQRARALHALAQMRLLPDGPPSPAGTISDTLDEDTPYASPDATPRHQSPVPRIGSLTAGDQAPVQAGEATPGFTPPQSPQRDVTLPWQDTRPPSVQPGQRCSACWRRPPHQRAEQAWHERPGIGTRFAELAAALRRAPGVSPATLLRLLRAAADCEDVEVGAVAADADGLEPAAAQLSALPPDAPCWSPQRCLYRGGALVAAAQALADDVRATPRRSRRRRHASHLSGDACPTDIDSDVDLREELRHPTPTLQDVPPFMRPGASRAWKLFLLTPRMLLARTEQRGSHGRAELLGRAAAFQRGDWIQLLQSARRVSRPAHDTPTLPPDEVAERKRHQACAKVRQGELSRARQVLTACDLAPGTEATWAALTDPARRPPEARTAIDPDILQHQPSQPVHLTTGAVAAALRSARRGSAPGLSAMCAEHLKFLLQDGEAIELLAEASALLAQARVPADVCKAIAMARRAALRKADGGVRGIATGDMFRRLVSKAPAREWVEKFDH